MPSHLTKGQTAILTAATLPMIAVGIGGALGTYANAASVLHRSQTALGIVAAGEGATLVVALVMLGLTMLGQPSPLAIRAALWLLPATASIVGLAIAPTPREAVVFAVTPMAMTVSAEGLGLLARRIVVKTSGIDVEAQRRNAEIMRRIAYLQARAASHPSRWVRKRSQLAAWRLMSRVGAGDTELGSGLIDVQRERLTEGADSALAAMLGTTPTAVSPPVSRELEPGPHPEPSGFETTVDTALHVAGPKTHREPPALLQPPPPLLPTRVDQHIRREPVLSPAEPATVTLSDTKAEPEREPDPDAEPKTDERETQILELAGRLRSGERLTKSSAAQLLGVSPATAGRRLKDARERLDDGTGMYL